MATTSRVSAGLRSSKVRPLTDSTHSPSMKFLKTLVLVVPPSITGLVMVSVAIENLLGIVLNFNANNRGEDGQARASAPISAHRAGAGPTPFPQKPVRGPSSLAGNLAGSHPRCAGSRYCRRKTIACQSENRREWQLVARNGHREFEIHRPRLDAGLGCTDSASALS